MSTSAYFDNAATTFVKPREVHDFMYEFYLANSVNVGRGNYNLLNDSNRIVAETRSMIRGLFHANNEFETIFTPSATEAINIVLQGQEWDKGDNIYISNFEHNAVYRTVKFLERKYDINIEFLATDKTTLSLDFESIKHQFARKSPSLVIVTHVSNVCGNIADIVSLGKIAKMYNATYAIDCAQSAGLLETNIIECKADFMIFAGHKTLYGPFGCSGFVCRNTSNLKPLIYGGTGVDSANQEMPLELPKRLEAGSPNIMAIAGLYSALKWHEKTGIENIRKKEEENYQKLYDILVNNKHLIIGKGTNSTSIISCRMPGLPTENYANILNQNGILVRSGLHCAPQAHKFLNTFPEGTVRFSVSYFTNEEDFSILKKGFVFIEGRI